mmetsp:Transcript_13972/g.37506  ORF Transcript_13972/g.37506 Transcript_13972/m.37506 type:complete len:131 (+) Transcript_13972:337-729(+)
MVRHGNASAGLRQLTTLHMDDTRYESRSKVNASIALGAHSNYTLPPACLSLAATIALPPRRALRNFYDSTSIHTDQLYVVRAVPTTVMSPVAMSTAKISAHTAAMFMKAMHTCPHFSPESHPSGRRTARC